MAGDGLYLDEVVVEIGSDLVLLPVLVVVDFLFGDFAIFEHVFFLDKGDFAGGEVREV